MVETIHEEFDCDNFRSLKHVCEPDPRSLMFARIDCTTGGWRTMELADHHEAVVQSVLHPNVPEKVAIQFETARNLYLHAWFVYRFYPVAQQHSIACLEMALRTRLHNEILAGKLKSKRPTLRPLLEYAVLHKLIRNEGFEVWRQRGPIRARARVELEKTREMVAKGLDEILWDDSEIEVKQEDLEWDYVSELIRFLPLVRNDYAHGSTTLHNQAVGDLLP
jgi:hypothetical protein